MSTRQAIGESFDPRRNSLNLIRLVLALVVVVSHSWPLGGFGPEPRIGSTTIGTLAVMCFFAISGFLISSSRERAAGGRFLWHRMVRILPGYWICLLVIATVIAPLAWFHYNGTLAGYPSLGAVRYVVAGLVLKTDFVPSIPGTQVSVEPSLNYWNGAAWSLFFEFICYVCIAVLASLRLFRPWVVAVGVAVGSILLVLWEYIPGSMDSIIFHSHDAFRLVTTGTVFAAGSLLWLIRDRIWNRSWMACIAFVLTSAGLICLRHPEWLVAIPVAYLCIWLAIELPCSGVVKRLDISYGVYIYGYPVAMLLAIYGASSLPLTVYLGLTFLIVVPMAFASWFAIERRALRLKDFEAPLPWIAPHPRHLALSQGRPPIADESRASELGAPDDH